MSMRTLASLLLAALTISLLPLPGHAVTGPDLGLSASNIRFSTAPLIAGADVRLYATVRNFGDQDAVAQVIFYQGALLLGRSQVVSVLADGASDDVFIDFTVPDAPFNIRAVIGGVEPADINSANNEALTPLYTPILDVDRDGVADEEDNCPTQANAGQGDQDDDGVGDVCDADVDGDGLSAAQEEAQGTNPTIADTNGDGIIDGQQPPVTQTIPTPAPVPAPVASTPVATERPLASTESAASTEEISSTSVVSESDTAFAAPTRQWLGSREQRSPAATFWYRKQDWRTYIFAADAADPADVVRYAWDFGDGATSAQPSLSHAFPSSGVYRVTLTLEDSKGNIVTDSQELSISFFHLQNPWVVAMIVGLLALLLALIWTLARVRRRGSIV